MSETERLDVALVRRGLIPSREKAQALIMAGLVYIGEEKASKPSEKVGADQDLTVRGAPHPYVSRGALKLEKGLAVFPVQTEGVIAIDVGASTGGFTDLLLQRGAGHVYAVDVGYGQLDWRLRSDERVTVMERTNARYLKPGDFAMPPTLAVMDVSFISILKILPALREILGPGGQVISLIKPQFEAGKERVGKKGVVRDPDVHRDVLRSILGRTRETGWVVHGLDYSPVTGPEGNIEFLLYLAAEPAQDGQDIIESVDGVVRAAHEALRPGSP